MSLCLSDVLTSAMECTIIYHLASLSFTCDDNLSSFHTSSCGVPKALFSAPLLFVEHTTMHQTPLSTLMSSLFLDQRLYADETQVFSFHPLNFD